MKYIFIKDKDGHRKGEIVELEASNFYLTYWTKKQAIEPFCREDALAIETHEPVIETPEQVGDRKEIKVTRKRKSK